MRSLSRVQLLEISTEDFQALLNRRAELEYQLACGITQRLLDTEINLLRTIADKDRKLALALTETKFHQSCDTEASEYYKMIIKTDPVCEAAYQKLMLIYSNGGMRAEALKVYEDCRKTLEREIGVEPGRLTSSIYRRIIELS